MKNLFKKNPALFIGLVLPLLMILAFAGIPFIASFVVLAPKYNFIYSLYNYGSNGKLRVVDGQLVLRVYNPSTIPQEVRQQLYWVDVHSKKSTNLNFNLPKEENSLIPPHQSREFIIEGISLQDLDASNISPDGYQIRTGNNDNFSSLIFFFGGRRNYLSLSKSGRIVSFPTPAQGYGGVKFEGWIIPK